ncbi:hypothetical protein QYE76_036236 [Lolium multiflorum]|uniref:F-box domain-containing protein n=1 Tax=Lolium multiflorum TaxID=4521 RepID=A0AAD8R0M6_LOLMU|nr:hypothetical protein QYE76_036236 [Lolium multiflorum]
MVEPCSVLPDDIIEDILARLPAKTVYRCRWLSRTWMTRLISNDFAEKHFRLANGHGGPRILLLHDSMSTYGCGKVQMWSPDNPDGTNPKEIPTSQRGTSDFIFVDGCAKVHMRSPDGTNLKEVPTSQRGMNHIAAFLVTQQCRGLVILKAIGHSHTYYVLNPSTGQMAVLPQSPTMIHCETTPLGLGYDTHAKKHKVVCIRNHCDNAKKTFGFNACEVYVINSTTKDWRPVESKEKQRGMDLAWTSSIRLGTCMEMAADLQGFRMALQARISEH